MDRFEQDFPPAARHTSCAVAGDEHLVNDYAAAGRLPDCTELAEISRRNPRMPIPQLLDAFDAHRLTCQHCMEIEREDAQLQEPDVMPADMCPTRYELICGAETLNLMRLAIREHEAECAVCGATKAAVEFDRKLWQPRYGPRIANMEGVCCVRKVA